MAQVTRRAIMGNVFCIPAHTSSSTHDPASLPGPQHSCLTGALWTSPALAPAQSVWLNELFSTPITAPPEQEPAHPALAPLAMAWQALAEQVQAPPGSEAFSQLGRSSK